MALQSTVKTHISKYTRRHTHRWSGYLRCLKSRVTVKEEKARRNVKVPCRETDGKTERKKQLETQSYHHNHERSSITEVQKLALTQGRLMAEMRVKR